jgi:hypothetical protein
MAMLDSSGWYNVAARQRKHRALSRRSFEAADAALDVSTNSLTACVNDCDNNGVL